MDPAQIRRALLARRAEVLERLRGLDASFTDIVESAQDSNLDDEHDPEGQTIAVSRAQVSSLTAAAHRQLIEVDAALARLDDGTYGTCERCGAVIADGRLEVRPETRTCVACAERPDHRRVGR